MSLTMLGSQQCMASSCALLRPRASKTACPVSGYGRPGPLRHSAIPERQAGGTLDIKHLSNVITAQAMEGGEQQHVLEEMAKVLGEPLASIKNMAFRQKELLKLDPAEIKAKVELVAKIVDVPYEKARQICVIQPSFLTDTQRQAEALTYGLRIICHDLKASKDEMLELIMTNPSLLHGRQMRLSVADMAHLALLREPKSRIVD